MAWPGKGKESGKAKQAEEEMRWQSRRHEPGHWQCRWALETSTSPGSFVKLSVLSVLFQAFKGFGLGLVICFYTAA